MLFVFSISNPYTTALELINTSEIFWPRAPEEPVINITESLKSKLATPRERACLEYALRYINSDCDYPLWRNIVWAILSTGWVDAHSIALNWSQTTPERFDETSFQVLTDSFDETHERRHSVGTVYYHARLGGWLG